MNAKDILESAAVAGFEIALKEDGCTPTIKHPEQARPNAALMAALRTHRREIVTLLGGYIAPEHCEDCKAFVYEAIDSENFCRMTKCQFRRRVR